MANKKISALDLKSTLTGSEELGINDGGTNKKVTAQAIADLSGGSAPVDSVNGQTGVVVLDTGDISEATDKNYVTDAESTVLGNTSGSNTGDQDLSPLATKANVLELDNTTVFTPVADYEPATKKYVDDNAGGGGGNGPIISGYIAGEQRVGELGEFPMSKAITAGTFRATLKTKPTGSDFIIKLYKNGVEDASVTIATGATATNGLFQATDTSFISGSYVATDVLKVEITQIGSSVAGSTLTYSLTE